MTDRPIDPPGAPAPILYAHRHLLGIEGLSVPEITSLLDLADSYVEQNRQADKKRSLLRGRTVINLFFENSTRPRTSFALAGKRHGPDLHNHSVTTSRTDEQRLGEDGVNTVSSRGPP